MSKGTLFKDALAELQEGGFRVGSDKLQRFRGFGIHSTRIGRAYYIEPRVLGDLRYVLTVERAFQFSRDHDALSLELAYRAYHTVPWDRVHRGARKSVEIVMNKVNRELHRANNWGGIGFHPRRIPHLARQLARHFIPDRKIKHDPSNKLARDVLVVAIEMLLCASYNNENFMERDFCRLLYMLGGKDPQVIELAPKITVMLNTICPLLRLTGVNPLQAVLKPDPSESDIQGAISIMRKFPKLWHSMKSAGSNAYAFNSGLS